MRQFVFVFAIALLSTAAPAFAQAPTPAPTDRTKASVFTAEDLAAALAKVPTDRPSGSARVFTLAPYSVNVEQRQPRQQGASMHDAQAEFFYVIDGTATLLTGGSLTSPTRNGTNVTGPAIEGGVRQTFKKGDFVVVPSGVPHQFVDIKAPIHLLQLYLPNVPQ